MADDLDDEAAAFKNLYIYSLKIILYEGRKIPKLDIGGWSPSDPYLVATLFDGEKSKDVHRTMGKTSVIHNSESPKWGKPQEGQEDDVALLQRARNSSMGSTSSSAEETKDMDMTLSGEEINLETADPNATLYLQLFDEDDDVDDLIGEINIDLSKYQDKQGLPSSGEWIPLINKQKRGDIRIFISFQKRELGPSAVRKLNTNLTNLMNAPKWGLVEMLRPAMERCFIEMIKGGNIGNEDRKGKNLTQEQLEDMEYCSPQEELCWKASQFCYSSRKSRQMKELEKLVLDIVLAADDASLTFKEAADEYSDEQTGSRNYPTYRDVYNSWFDEGA